ncbi:MAG: hypothetical protein HY553_11335 [Elusimicrobia bacterium]|nr:hypothetical protein [Elusimicrobiota bacterium]
MRGEELLERCALKSNDELFRDLRTLDADEGEALADILAHLATLDDRGSAWRGRRASTRAF